jgi:hypothetical protein
MSQMDVQKASYLSVEVDLAPLNAGTEERTWAHIKNRSLQAYAVRMDQTSNIDTVTDFHLCHCSLFQTNVGRHRKLSARRPFAGKGFFLLIERYSTANCANDSENDRPPAAFEQSALKYPAVRLKALQLSELMYKCSGGT